MLDGNTVQKFSLGILLDSIGNLIDLLQGWGRIGRAPKDFYERIPECYLLVAKPIMNQLAGGSKPGYGQWEERQSRSTSFFSKSHGDISLANDVLGFTSVSRFLNEIEDSSKCILLALNQKFVTVQKNCERGCTNCNVRFYFSSRMLNVFVIVLMEVDVFLLLYFLFL